MGKITTKFYLNRRLKPQVQNNVEKYPLYIEVIANRQRTQFKARSSFDFNHNDLLWISDYYSEDEFSVYSQDTTSGLSKYIYYNKCLVDFLLLDVASRKEFNIHNFLKVYELYTQSFYCFVEDTNKETFRRFLNLNDYKDLDYLINWEDVFSWIYTTLRKVIYPDSPYFAIFEHYTPALSDHALELYFKYSESYLKGTGKNNFMWDLSCYHVFSTFDFVQFRKAIIDNLPNNQFDEASLSELMNFISYYKSEFQKRKAAYLS